MCYKLLSIFIDTFSFVLKDEGHTLGHGHKSFQARSEVGPY